MPAPKTTHSRPVVALGPRDRVMLVAGGGRLPVNVANGLERMGHRPFVLLIEGEADEESGLGRFEHESMPLGGFARLLPRIRKLGITHVVLAGSIGRRPTWREVRFDVSIIRIILRILKALTRGDDGLLKVVIASFEEEGFKVVGAHQIVPDLLAHEGAMTATTPTGSDRRDLEAAYAAAKAIGALDIGQAAVAIGGRAIALEGIEGTDGLLDRVAGLRGHGRLAGKGRGVLVKCAKPGQEIRVDLPTIGPATVDRAHAAGLAGIAVEAERSLVLDYEAVVEKADRLGMFVIGLPPSDVP